MAITRQLHESVAFREVWLANWQWIEWLKPSAVKRVIATLEARLVIRWPGRISNRDAAPLRKVVYAIITDASDR